VIEKGEGFDERYWPQVLRALLQSHRRILLKYATPADWMTYVNCLEKSQEVMSQEPAFFTQGMFIPGDSMLPP
jgi:hypothetical protein